MASATRAPTPWTEVSRRNQSRSAAVAKPTSRIESSATSISVWSTTSSPIAPSAESVRDGGGDEIADAVDVDHRVIGAEAVEQPPQLCDHAAGSRKGDKGDESDGTSPIGGLPARQPQPEGNPKLNRLRLKGLDPNRDYKLLGEETVFGGDQLLYAGLAAPQFFGDYASKVFRLNAVE